MKYARVNKDWYITIQPLMENRIFGLFYDDVQTKRDNCSKDFKMQIANKFSYHLETC